MNILAFLSLLSTLIDDAPKFMSAIAFIVKLMGDVEGTGQTGSQKLDAVLNDTEAYLNANFPNLAAPFETIATSLEAAIGTAVTLLNMFGIFKPKTA
jgi:hypothetical protein